MRKHFKVQVVGKEMHKKVIKFVEYCEQDQLSLYYSLYLFYAREVIVVLAIIDLFRSTYKKMFTASIFGAFL